MEEKGEKDFIEKAKVIVEDLGGKIEESINDLKEQADKITDGIEEQSKIAQAAINAKILETKEGIEKKKNEIKYWFSVCSKEDMEGWGDKNDLLLEKAEKLQIEAYYYIAAGNRFLYIHCPALEMDKLISELGEDDFEYKKMAKKVIDLTTHKRLIPAFEVKQKKTENTKKKREKLDDQLKAAIKEYNLSYASLSDHGTILFYQRERAIDLIDNIENLINSIANHPKEFDAVIAEVRIEKKQFRETCEFAKEELSSAQKSAVGAGAGIAGGVAVAALAPTAAMWVATTFGTASTGTAISTLSGAAATNAAIAWLGGGAAAAGGGGMAAGSALLSLAGPIGWGIAGATILTSIILFANKKRKLDKEKKEEIEAVLRNTESVKELDIQVDTLLKKTEEMRSRLNEQYTSALAFFADNFLDLDEDDQLLLGTIVNNTKALALSLKEGI